MQSKSFRNSTGSVRLPAEIVEVFRRRMLYERVEHEASDQVLCLFLALLEVSTRRERLGLGADVSGWTARRRATWCRNRYRKGVTERAEAHRIIASQ
jgi:hypothetical protein